MFEACLCLNWWRRHWTFCLHYFVQLPKLKNKSSNFHYSRFIIIYSLNYCNKHLKMRTCTSMQHPFESTEEDFWHVIGMVDVIWIDLGRPLSSMINCGGETNLIPRKNGELSNSAVLLPIMSCLAWAEHCNWKRNILIIITSHHV